MCITSRAGPPLMASKATTCLLIALTLISPSACCCSFGAAADWVIQGIFLETGVPQPASCCHRMAAPVASHAGGSRCHQQGTHSGTESHCPSESHDGDSHRCPCREDGSGRSGPASPLDLIAATTSPVLNALQAPYVVPMHCGVANPEAIAPAFSFVPPHGLSDGGQGILRAYGRLRI